jgi:hypothetical protein
MLGLSKDRKYKHSIQKRSYLYRFGKSGDELQSAITAKGAHDEVVKLHRNGPIIDEPCHNIMEHKRGPLLAA